MVSSWRYAWQHGVGPVLPGAGLTALKEALEKDSPELWQPNIKSLDGINTTIPFLRRCRVRQACAIEYCGWKGEGLKTQGELWDYCADICERAEELAGPFADDAFTWWFCTTPRDEMRRLLLPEVNRELARRVETGKPASRVRLKRRTVKSVRQLVAC